jgi:hypothetical protein
MAAPVDHGAHHASQGAVPEEAAAQDAAAVECPHHRVQAAGEAGEPGSTPAVLRCVCRTNPVALAAVLMGQGILPSEFHLPYDAVSQSITAIVSASVAHVSLLGTPPPRA